ncbi:MAG: hypothetical protein ACPG49_14045 [Chitinophagales bacterium]
MYQIPRQLIAENKRTRAKSLDLGNCMLVDLKKDVPELFECVWLERLILGDWYLDLEDFDWNNWVFEDFNSSKWAAEHFNRKKKESANKDEHNQLSCLPVEISQLRNLKELYLGKVSDEKTSLKAISKLSKLESLVCSGKENDNLKFLKKLTRLQVLILDFPQLSDICVLRRMKQLRILIFTDTRIKEGRVLEKLNQLQVLAFPLNKIPNIS